MSDEQLTSAALRPLINALFPDITYTHRDFRTVLRDLVRPVILKRYSWLTGISAVNLPSGGRYRVEVVMPSMGYEWQTPEWRARFREALASS